MSFITKKHLSRRTFLRGIGVTLSLPLLESMVPAQTPLAKTAANPRMRLGLCFMPHGAVMSQWTPAEEGALKLSPILAPLEPHKDHVVVISNLAHKMAGPQGPGDNGGDHTRCPAVYLNGVHPKRTDGADIRAGATIDQIAAQKIGQDTLLPSLELAIEDYSGLVGSCDVGFSCTYMNTISWRTPTTPMPMEINPRVVFDRMFGDGATAEERLLRGFPSRVASSEQCGPAGSFDQDQYVPRHFPGLSAGAVEERAGRRRQSARSFADPLRWRDEQQQRS